MIKLINQTYLQPNNFLVAHFNNKTKIQTQIQIKTISGRELKIYLLNFNSYNKTNLKTINNPIIKQIIFCNFFNKTNNKIIQFFLNQIKIVRITPSLLRYKQPILIDNQFNREIKTIHNSD